MALIVGVHGIGKQFESGYGLEPSWYQATRGGLKIAGHRVVAESLMPADLRVAFFGDLFRLPGSMTALDPPYVPADITPGLERDMLAVFFHAAIAQDPSLGAPDGAMWPGRTPVHVMLNRLARSATFARIAQRAFIGSLKQVTAFLADTSVKESVLERVHEEVGRDTKVIIGHSLGSVVVYEYMCRYSPPSVELLVTAGSPLGIPNVVFDQLTPAPVGAGPRLRRQVTGGRAGRWVMLTRDACCLAPAGGRCLRRA
ncbi:MAG: hypothetical protein ACLP8X_21790 [Streptosporangiaceae bacterium]